ncbi:hypothetical protein [Microbacterium sp. GXF7504]
MSDTRSIRGAVELDALLSELENTTPACIGDGRFTMDEPELAPGDTGDMLDICASCDLIVLCAEYARRGKPTGGFWAGRRFDIKPRTPASGAVRLPDAAEALREGSGASGTQIGAQRPTEGAPA